MGVDVLKKLKGEAKKRKEQQEKRRGPGEPSTPSAPARPQFEPAGRFFVSNNWKNLLEKRPSVAPKVAAAQAPSNEPGVGSVGPGGRSIVAMDCEMVGVGPSGTQSVLARVSIVDHEGKVLLDKYVRPDEPVTDYRTRVTGITSATLQRPGVLQDSAARQMAADILRDKIVVGHALQNDFEVLQLDHPHALIRDTALYKPLRPEGREKKLPSLHGLVKHWLHETIHDGVHDSVQDASAALRLYRLRSRQWEKQLRSVMRADARGTAGGPAGPEDEEEGEVVDRRSDATVSASAQGGRKKKKAPARLSAEVGAAAQKGLCGAAGPSKKQKRKRRA